jgi:hypothetical protein
MTKSGAVSTAMASIFTCDNKLGYSVTSIRFNNDIAYDVEVFLYVAKENKTVDIYKLELNAGDTFTDTFNYTLAFGDKILARSNVANTFYSLNIS